MRTFGSRETRNNITEVKLMDRTIDWVLTGTGEVSHHTHGLHVLLNILNNFLISARLFQIIQTSLIHGKESNCCSVFWTHIGNGSSVSNTQLGHALSKELDKFANHSNLSKMLGDGENNIRGGHMRPWRTCDLVSHHLGQNHGDGLPQHHGLGLDTTHTPSNNSEAIDHGGVTICADHAVWIQQSVFVETNSCKILQVDLVNDARSRRNYQHVLECLSAPLEEGESFMVSLKLKSLVLCLAICGSGHVHLNR